MKNRQFTATVFIFHGNHVLLIYHKKMKKWLPPGGHMEPGELPTEAAIREAKEETGLDIELILQENIWVTPRFNGASFARPFMCLLEEIPPHGEMLAHQHIDFIYLGKPIGGNLSLNTMETEGLKWFTLEEVHQLKVDEEIFLECKELISHIFSNNDKNFPSYRASVTL